MWLEIGELTPEDRKYIAILGRALLVCQRVETTVKWFTQIVEVSAAWFDAPQTDPKEIAVKTDKYTGSACKIGCDGDADRKGHGPFRRDIRSRFGKPELHHT